MMILVFIFGVVITLFPLCIITHRKDTHPKNKVHFYVAKDKDPFNEGLLTLWINKPERGVDIWYVGKSLARYIAAGSNLELFGLTPSDYDNLKWEDEPVEVFLTLK